MFRREDFRRYTGGCSWKIPAYAKKPEDGRHKTTDNLLAVSDREKNSTGFQTTFNRGRGGTSDRGTCG